MGSRALSLSVGNLVKWYEEYSDGIVKDGILVEIIEHSAYGNTFKVYRNKFKDFIWLSGECIEKIQNENINNRS